MADEEHRIDDADESLSTGDDEEQPELYSILKLARAVRMTAEKAERDSLIDKDLADKDE